MNYEKIYCAIIKNRQLNPLPENVYGETHHINPKSLGGSNQKSNLVRLTAREHFLCHYCLVEMYDKGTMERSKMLHAFNIMKAGSRGGQHKGQRYLNSKLYAAHKEEYGKLRTILSSGMNNNSYGKSWIYSVIDKKSISVIKSELDYYLNLGWKMGRIINFDNIEIQKQRQIEKEIAHNKIEEEKKELYNYYYNIYKNHTFKEFCAITGFNKDQSILCRNFPKYIENYQNLTEKSKHSSEVKSRRAKNKGKNLKIIL